MTGGGSEVDDERGLQLDGAALEHEDDQPQETTYPKQPVGKLDGDDDDDDSQPCRKTKKERAWNQDDQSMIHVSVEARRYMRERAEDLRQQLDKRFPSFTKVVSRSDALGRCSLRLSDAFCKDHMPMDTSTDVLLSACDGWFPYPAVYNPGKKSLTSGWRRFTADSGLADGDALVFQLLSPKTFKVYILRSDDFAAAEASTYLKAVNSDSKHRKSHVQRMVIDSIIAKASARPSLPAASPSR